MLHKFKLLWSYQVAKMKRYTLFDKQNVVYLYERQKDNHIGFCSNVRIYILHALKRSRIARFLKYPI